MPILMIWIVYAILVVATVPAVRKMRADRLDFIDGIVVGVIFYVAIPMAVILASGNITTIAILAAPYAPTEDVATTFTLFLGWGLVIVLSWLPRPASTAVVVNGTTSRRVLYTMLGLYFVIQSYTFAVSGVGDAGSHWQHTLGEALGESTSFIILKNFANSFRTMVFGALVVAALVGALRPRTAALVGLGVCAFDMFTSFNRITIVYFFFSMTIIYRKHIIAILVTAAVALPAVVSVSNMWPMFRSTALIGGWNIASFASAWSNAALYSQSTANRFVEQMNGIFESSNIVVLNYVVHYSGDRLPTFWGWTYLRPFVTFIPSTIWSDKPRVFSVYVGEAINNTKGLALNSTLLGEAVGNFPYFWPLVLGALLLMFRALYGFAERFVPGARTMSFFVAIALWRFDVNFASASLYALVVVYFVLMLYRYVAKSSAREQGTLSSRLPQPVSRR